MQHRFLKIKDKPFNSFCSKPNSNKLCVLSKSLSCLMNTWDPENVFCLCFCAGFKCCNSGEFSCASFCTLVLFIFSLLKE